MTTRTVVRAGLFTLTIVALGIVPGVSVAKAPSKATGHGDFTGTDGNMRSFAFSAIQQPSGKVAGQAEIHNRATGDFVHMDIDCLNIPENASNTAFVGGLITKSSIPGLLEQTGAFEAIDNGEGTNASSLDKLSGLVLADCNSSLTLELFDVLQGNIQVRP